MPRRHPRSVVTIWASTLGLVGAALVGITSLTVTMTAAAATQATDVTVVVPSLASTGSVVPLWLPIGAGLLVALGIVLLVLRRRFAPRRRH